MSETIKSWQTAAVLIVGATVICALVSCAKAPPTNRSVASQEALDARAGWENGTKVILDIWQAEEADFTKPDRTLRIRGRKGGVLAAQKLVLGQDQRILAESLAKGKIAIVMGLSYYSLLPFAKAGLPVKSVPIVMIRVVPASRARSSTNGRSAAKSG